MPASFKNVFRPNPITKIFVVFITGLTVVHSIDIYFEWAIIFLLSALFYLNGEKKAFLKWIGLCALLFLLPNFMVLSGLHPMLKMFLSIPIIVRMFLLPFMAASFMIKTSDVGSIISSMDALKISKNISIPVAVMFRFFPSYREEKKNIKTAMKIRGITLRHPLKYLECVTVPLLILSSNIAEDIAKAAETKAIESPVAKTRYIPVTVQAVDFLYAFAVTGLVIGGWICLK